MAAWFTLPGEESDSATNPSHGFSKPLLIKYGDSVRPRPELNLKHDQTQKCERNSFHVTKWFYSFDIINPILSDFPSRGEFGSASETNTRTAAMLCAATSGADLERRSSMTEIVVIVQEAAVDVLAGNTALTLPV